MKSLITSTIALLALTPVLHADLISWDRLSQIHAEGTTLGDQTTISTDLTQTFDQSIFLSSDIAEIGVSQLSTVTSQGFSLSTSFTGQVFSFPEFSIFGTNTVFTLGFYVDTPSILTLSASLSRPLVKGGFGLRVLERDGTSIGVPDGYAYIYGDPELGGPLPQAFQLDLQHAYVLTYSDGDGTDYISGVNSFSQSTQITGNITPTPEPNSIILVGFGFLLFVLRRTRCKSTQVA